MIVLGLLNGLDFIDEVQEGEGSGHVPFSPDGYALQDDIAALVGNGQVDGKDQRRLYAVHPDGKLGQGGHLGSKLLESLPADIGSVVPYCFLGQKGQIAEPESLLGKITFQ